MATRPINLFGLGFHSKSPNVSAIRLTNAYYEFKTGDADRTKVVAYGTPGLTRITTAGSSPWRGLLKLPGTSLGYGVAFNVFYEIDNVGNLTPRGTISSTEGKVGMATDGTQILVVDGSHGYGFDTSDPSTPIAEITDSSFPDNAQTCTFQGGRFLVDNGALDVQGSDPYDVFTWPSLNIKRAESNPQTIVRVWEQKGAVLVFKEQSIEPWQNIGGSGFPYQRILGVNLAYGLGARWSLAPFMGGLAFLSSNQDGQVTVSRLDGYQIISMSNPEFDQEINSYSQKSDATAIGYSYGGHPFYQLNFPNEGKSWLYDGSTEYWSELSSGDSRHRAELGIDFLGRTILSDYEDGRLYNFNPDLHQDDGDVQKMIIRGRHQFLPGNPWFRLDRLELLMENAVGTSLDPNPHVALRLSKDGGHVFGTTLLRPIGKVGAYRNRVIWRGLGRARDIVPEISISSPVKRVVTGAIVTGQPGIS